MSITVELNLDNSKVLKKLHNLATAGEDLSPVMKDIAGIFADASEQAFNTEVDPNTGQPWEPLTEAHSNARKERGYIGSILAMTGQLAASLQSDYGMDFAQVGSNLTYAAIHQHGGIADMRPSNAAIHARPFLGVSHEDREEIMAALEAHLNSMLP